MSRRRGIVAATALLGALLLAAAIFGRPILTSTAAQHSRATGPVTADTILQSFNDAFLMQSNGSGYYRLTTAGGLASFFKQTEMIEMTEDAYQRSGNPDYKMMIGVLYSGLIAHHGTDWLRNPSNDDLMWAVIMCLRAYTITGDKAYLRQAKSTFDRTYARSWSPALGGGLWNTTRRLGKNTCVNAPAVIAACMLYQSLHDTSYLAKAKRLYRWLRTTLYNPATGAVYDHVSPAAGSGGTKRVVLDRTAFTYNQGGFIGAADLLHGITSDRRYYTDALKSLRFTRDSLTVGGILKSEVAANGSRWVSSGGFKGMFVRWASIFIRDNHVRGYGPWFRQNAAAVRSRVNAAGLMNEDWSAQTGTDPLSAFSCSSAVVLLQWYPPAVEARRPAATPGR
jgi:Glycosyl hydrolase family 76